MSDPTFTARALWYTAPETVALGPVDLAALSNGRCRIQTLYTGISRGTESLVYFGQVPQSEYQRMATPLMTGQLPYPVVFGYCNVGRVIDGPDGFIGQTVFCLGPHQTLFDAPSTMLAPLPPNVPAKRGVLAANMETALNAVWTGKPGPADQVVIIGGGVVGLLVAYLCKQLPRARVTLVDPLPARAATCERLGIAHAASIAKLGNCDVVFHASGHPGGLQDALSVAGNEATVVELSWYGSKAVCVELGGAFHSQQLRVQSCQVGHVESNHRPRWDYQRRLSAALELLADELLDHLLEPAVAFEDAAQAIHDVFKGQAPRLCQVIDFSARS